ncbi:hypothetical protein KA013_03330 [Patescibacteria group bacterium]|nr:hypothetical protein [Patescibacteria group bacterium]
MTYSYNKPRQLILRHKLHQLEKRDDLINTAQQLLRQTAGVHEEYEDLDSIKNTKDIKKLVERL